MGAIGAQAPALLPKGRQGCAQCRAAHFLRAALFAMERLKQTLHPFAVMAQPIHGKSDWRLWMLLLFAGPILRARLGSWGWNSYPSLDLSVINYATYLIVACARNTGATDREDLQ